MWLESKLSQAHEDDGWDPKETADLLEEAEHWRWGHGNRTIDPTRAVSLYWAAAAGTGPAAASALNQLAWLHVVPADLAPAVPVASEDMVSQALEPGAGAQHWSSVPRSEAQGWLPRLSSMATSFLFGTTADLPGAPTKQKPRSRSPSLLGPSASSPGGAAGSGAAGGDAKAGK